MEKEDVDDNSTNKRTLKRKEIIERKKVVDGLIKAASAVNDPLDSFPEFRRRNLQGLCFHLEAGLGTKLSRILKQYVKKLLEVNMKGHYGMEWTTEEKVKYREINAPEARYIFVYKALSSDSCEPDRFMSDEKGDIVGFVHYRFILEENLPVLYLYELQLEPEIQGKGLGRLLMQLLELIAQKSGMSAIVLTVQKRNQSAMVFYTSKLGYSIAATSPSRVEPLRGAEVNYEILCKAFDQEAKSILEIEVITLQAPSASQSSGRRVLESSEDDSVSLRDDDDLEYDLESDQLEKSQDQVQDDPVEEEALVSSSSGGVKFKRAKTSSFERYSEDTSWIIKGPCPGGPPIPLVIPSFGGHIAYSLWSDPSSVGRPLLTGYHRWDKVKELAKWAHFSPGAKPMVLASRLWHLFGCMAEEINMPLICAFVERWQPDTNTFHMPFGEITILLHDVELILGIPMEGDFCRVSKCAGSAELVDPLVHVCDFFGKTLDELRLPLRSGMTSPIYNSRGVFAEAVKEVAKTGSVDKQAQGYLTLLLGTTLFADKSGDRIRPDILALMGDNKRIESYAWGAGTLAYMYRNLGIATRARVKTINGCLSLLQAWIYEYFPLFRPGPPNEMPDPPTDSELKYPRAMAWSSVGPFVQTEAKLLQYRRQLDVLTASSVNWEPFGAGIWEEYICTLLSGCIRFVDIVEAYQPDRCLRQFGYRQIIPALMPRVSAHRPASGIGYKVDFGDYADHPWVNKIDHLVHIHHRSIPVSIPGETDDRYGEWYRNVSHPLIIDPEFVGAPVGDGTDVTAETAHTMLDRLSQGETIADEKEQARYFRSMLSDFLPLLPRKDAISGAGDGSPTLSSLGGRSGGGGCDGDDSGGSSGAHGSCDRGSGSFSKENVD